MNTRIEVDRANLIQIPCAFPVFMWSHAGFGGNQSSLMDLVCGGIEIL